MGQIPSETADVNSNSTRGRRTGHSRSTRRSPTPSTTRRGAAEQFLQFATTRPTTRTQFFHAATGYGADAWAASTRDDAPAPRGTHSLPVTGSLKNGSHATSGRTLITLFKYFWLWTQNICLYKLSKYFFVYMKINLSKTGFSYGCHFLNSYYNCCQLTLTHDVICDGAPKQGASISQVHIGATQYRQLNITWMCVNLLE